MVTRPLGGGATNLGVREDAQALGRPPLKLLKPLPLPLEEGIRGEALPLPLPLPQQKGEGGEALQLLFAMSEDDSGASSLMSYCPPPPPLPPPSPWPPGRR